MALRLKPDLLQQFLGCFIVRVRKRRHQRQPNLGVGDIKRRQRKFRAVSLAPSPGMKEKRQLRPPSWIERIIIQSAPTDNFRLSLRPNCPRSKSVPAAAPLMDRNPPPARRQIPVDLGELHCPRIPKKTVELWHLGNFGSREQQSVSLDIPAQGYFPLTKTPPDRHAVCFFDPKNDVSD
jgi:hypothetical protein